MHVIDTTKIKHPVETYYYLLSMPFVGVCVILAMLFGRLAFEIYALLYLSTILPYITSLIHSFFIPLYTYGCEFL